MSKIALLTAFVLCALQNQAATFYQGTVYVERNQHTTVELPSSLISEYNNYGAGYGLSWSVSNSCLVIGTTAMYHCNITPRNGVAFADNVTLRCKFNSWYGTTLMENVVEWTVKLKEGSTNEDATQILLSDTAIVLTVKERKHVDYYLNPYKSTSFTNYVAWESSDPQIATVDEQGNVTAVAEGTTSVICTLKSNNTVQTTLKVTVKGLWSDAGHYTISWYKKGEAEFTISTNKELAGLAYLVNNGYTTFDNTIIKIGADIDLGERGWIPIGNTSGRSFNGSFDGQGYTIKGLYIGAFLTDQEYYGLFGVAYGGSGRYLKNITLRGEINVSLSIGTNNNYGGKSYVGGLVGKFCGWTGEIENSLCYMPISYEISGSGYGYGVYIGGVAGEFDGTIEYCLHEGNLSYKEDGGAILTRCQIGGIAGAHYGGQINYCENFSEIVTYKSLSYTGGWRDCYPRIGGIVGGYDSASSYKSSYSCINICNKSIINTINLLLNSGYKNYDCKLFGISQGGSKNCYSSIKEIQENNSSNCIGDISYIANGEACFTNSDMVINVGSLILSTQTEASTAYSSEQMKTNTFLDELNMYSILNMDGPVWVQNANGGYPYIEELHKTTGIRPTFIDRERIKHIFNLSGQRLTVPKKGINIIGGKKFVVK